jgi:hypothetical protein
VIFDRLVSLIERTDSAKMKQMAGEARLFHFPIDPHEALPKSHSEEQMKFLREQFFLPFDTVAVEDNASCVIIKDLRENQIGLINEPRLFIECITSKASPKAFIDTRWIPDGFSMVSMGVMMFDSLRENGYDTMVKACHIFVYNERGIVDHFETEDYDILKPVSQNWVTAIEEVLLLNTPDRFVLEKTPRKSRKNPKKILRSCDRPIYTLLHPSAIREAMRLSSFHEGGHKAPHERRRHWRHLSSERYKEARGKDILIAATWIGPHENEHGGHRYKVMLDL